MNLGDTLQIAGGLLPRQLLERVAAGDPALPGTGPADYHQDSHNELNQAINRAWSALCGRWMSFKAALEKLPDSDRATALTRERWLLPLFQELGYGRLQVERAAITADDRPFAISHRWGHLPVHLLGARIDLDKRIPGERGAAASPPHGLVQDLLNHADAHLWALLSNGRELRILRDHKSLTRQSYIAFDLAAIFDGEQFSAFRLLWLMCHQSRVEGADPRACWLERWAQLAQDDGIRALDRLRDGVETALNALGAGFLKNRAANATLLARLSSGQLNNQDYYRQLLRLVYRLIFLFVAEDRGLLLLPETREDGAQGPTATREARDRYQRLYATKRLRALAVRRRGGPHGDGWAALLLVMRQLDRGNPDLALPALGSFLWATDPVGGRRVSRAIPDLDGASLANEDLYAALAALCVVRDGPIRRPVDWAGVQTDELGSVYEALMERVPRLNVAVGTFTLETAAGNERKTTGSYYTPSSLVDCLLDSALEPVLNEAARAADPKTAILNLTLVDPACGSGHFLVAAARRIAHRLARARCGGVEPSPPEVQHAMRDVVGRCIYGVDLNPMAVELCKVSLWMEALEPGRPLSFLDGHIRHGNALLGTTPELMAKGIPDAAWDPIEGDDKEVAKRLKKANRARGPKSTQLALVGTGAGVSSAARTRRVAPLDEVDDSTPDGVAARAQAQEEYERVTAQDRFLADLWCAAFVWPKVAGEAEEAAPVAALWEVAKLDPSRVPTATRRIVGELAEQYRLFHWHLAFPIPFEHDGFDVVLGNPPWERVSLKEKEWFAQRAPEVAQAPTNDERLRRIAALQQTDPELLGEFRLAKRGASGEKSLLRSSGVYPLCGTGDVNTFAVFAELARRVCASMTGMVLPTGIATADTTQDFVAGLIREQALVSLFDFDNRAGIFPAVQGNVRFCLLTTARSQQSSFQIAAQLRSTKELEESNRVWRTNSVEMRRINPNTLTLPLFPNAKDAEICCNIYASHRCLDEIGASYPGRWEAPMQRMLHMGDDSGLFKHERQLEDAGYQRAGASWIRDDEEYVPLLEAKLCHQFDHRAGTFAGMPWEARWGTHPATRDLTPAEHLDPTTGPLPRYWVPTADVRRHIGDIRYLLGFRDAVSAVADSRSLVASIVPAHGAGDTLKFVFPTNARDMAVLLAWINSFPTDYVFRLKASGAHASFFLLRQLPMPSHDLFMETPSWGGVTRLVDWILARVLELSYTAWDLQPFAEDCGYQGPPFRWDPMRRAVLRAELDAAFFHLYGLARDEAAYIFETFQVLKRSDEKDPPHVYYTKLLTLGIYDAMAEAVRSGLPYQTRLDPPPAHSSVAHPPRTVTETPRAALDLTTLPAMAWARPGADARMEIGALLCALLKQIHRPTPSGELRLAALLALQAPLLLPSLSTAEAEQWQRLIGPTSAPGPAGVTPPAPWEDPAWGAAVVQLLATGLLIEDQSADTWAPGPGLDLRVTTGWPDGRAAFVLDVLARRGTEPLVQSLPEPVRRSLYAAAA